MDDIVERVTRLEEKVRSFESSIDELKKQYTAIQNMSIAIAEMGVTLKANTHTLTNIEKRLASVEHEPSDKYRKLRDAVRTAIVSIITTSILGAILSLILK